MVAGHYYTVRRCALHMFCSGERMGVWVQEVIRETCVSPDAPWGAYRFRLAESDHSEAGTVRASEPVNAH